MALSSFYWLSVFTQWFSRHCVAVREWAPTSLHTAGFPRVGQHIGLPIGTLLLPVHPQSSADAMCFRSTELRSTELRRYDVAYVCALHGLLRTHAPGRVLSCVGTNSLRAAASSQVVSVSPCVYNLRRTATWPPVWVCLIGQYIPLEHACWQCLHGYWHGFTGCAMIFRLQI